MMPDGLDIGDMMKQISENPAAREMLLSLLGGGNEEVPVNVGTAPQNSPVDDILPTHALPRRGRHIKQHHALLSALRPYLGERRCSTLGRMERALELYELIEQMRHTKGDSDVYT